MDLWICRGPNGCGAIYKEPHDDCEECGEPTVFARLSLPPDRTTPVLEFPEPEISEVPERRRKIGKLRKLKRVIMGKD